MKSRPIPVRNSPKLFAFVHVVSSHAAIRRLQKRQPGRYFGRRRQQVVAPRIGPIAWLWDFFFSVVTSRFAAQLKVNRGLRVIRFYQTVHSRVGTRNSVIHGRIGIEGARVPVARAPHARQDESALGSTRFIAHQRRRGEDGTQNKLPRNLKRFLVKRRRKVNQIVLGDALLIERSGFGWERLRRRGLLTRHLRLRNGPLL